MYHNDKWLSSQAPPCKATRKGKVTLDCSPLNKHIRGKDSDKAAVKAAKMCKIEDVNECVRA